MQYFDMHSARKILTSFDEASTMAYLHGNEVEAACDYEYARESLILREAAGMHIAKRLSGDVVAPLTKGLTLEEICQKIDEEFSCGDSFLASPWLEILRCADFPQQPWNSLSAKDRGGILHGFPLPCDKIPLRKIDPRTLRRLLAGQDLAGGQILPVVLDLNATPKQLGSRLAALLGLPQNKRVNQNRDIRTGKTGASKDRLKDLATWRLYDHCDNDWNKANDFADKHRRIFEKPGTVWIGSGRNLKRVNFKEGDPMPFHDARQGQEKHQINEASLYSEESGFLKARQRAKAYLEGTMFFELIFKANIALGRDFDERQKVIEKAYIQGANLAEDFEPLPGQVAYEKFKKEERKRVFAASDARLRALTLSYK